MVLHILELDNLRVAEENIQGGSHLSKHLTSDCPLYKMVDNNQGECLERSITYPRGFCNSYEQCPNFIKHQNALNQ